MKKLLSILLILSTGLTYGQKIRVLTTTSTSAQQAYNVKGADDSKKKSIDSLAALLRVEFKKELADSMKSLVPADNVTIVVKNGKFTAVGGGTTDLTPVYDTIEKLDAKLTASNLLIANNLNSLTTRVTTLEGKVTALESWRVTITAQLVIINSAIATIPKKATSTTITILE